VKVRTEVWPAATDCGLNDAVTPAGRPVTLNPASWEKPLALARLTAKLTDWPCIRSATAGSAVSVKFVEATIVSGTADDVVLLFAATVIVPVAAPLGIVNVIEVADTVATGAAIVPPPSFANVNWGAAPKFEPVTLTRVPIGPDFGLKSVITGCCGPAAGTAQ